MAKPGEGGDDPLLWDVDQVCANLLDPKMPWTQNPHALIKQINEGEIDGKTLLTYEFVCSRQELNEDLGIKLARHKAALGELIIGLRSRSRTFRRWKAEYDRKQALSAEQSQQSSQEISDELPVIYREKSQDTLEEGISSVITPAKRKAVSPSLPNKAPRISSTTPDRTPKPPQKRIVPVHLSTETSEQPSQAFLPSQADIVEHYLQPRHDRDADFFAWESAPPDTYLDPTLLRHTVVRSSQCPLSSRLVLEDSGSFRVQLPNPIPPGRRLMVYRTMRKMFMKNSAQEFAADRGDVPYREPSESDDDNEHILDLQDLPESVDEETKREMEEEEAEEEELAQRSTPSLLTSDQVSQILNDAIDAKQIAWKERKLYKLEKKAYKIWHDARKGRKRALLQAQQQAEFFNVRVKKLCVGILDSKWRSAREVQDQANSLDQTLEDKFYNLWQIEVLESRVEPPKPSTQARQARPPRPNGTKLHSDEELLTSSDEDDFIVADDDNAGLMDVEDFTPNHGSHTPVVKRESTILRSDIVDLTGVDTPPASFSSRSAPTYVDLTTPSKGGLQRIRHDGMPKVDSSLQHLDRLRDSMCYEDVRRIGEQKPKYWAAQQDVWRLVICLVWRITPHADQMLFFEFFKEHDAEEGLEYSLWIPRQQNPADQAKMDHMRLDPEMRTAYTITRIYLSYVKCKVVKEGRVAMLSKKDLKLISNAHDSYKIFHQFIVQNAFCFPTDAQVRQLNVPAHDGDESEEGSEPFQDTPSKRKPKEIIQDKKALDFRAEESKRTAEEDQRRKRLRAKLAKSGVMSEDKSRLIINESKRDDEAFIYVHDSIGPRIKDHQIDGVRFMWNHVLHHQGCLLAHTMGLGKTMQVITLLVAIAQSARDIPKTAQAQIPEDLRSSKTLVVCPAGLVENWFDELLIWAPEGLLGELRTITSVLSREQRIQSIRAWAEEGGVLVIGYNMMKKMVDIEEMKDLLIGAPNLVIADEAHNMKNPEAQVTQVCSAFETKARIALTGSPMANNVEEYYAMIEWVAPNFLGPLKEFRQIYAQPIQSGLWNDSDGYSKRQAMKMLQVLKETVAPKVHRAMMDCLRADLPPKYEYVILVAPTNLQQLLYDNYLQAIQGKGSFNDITQIQLFTVINHLMLLCNHPTCFLRKIEESAEKYKDDPTIYPPDIKKLIMKNVSNAMDVHLSNKVRLLNLILDQARELGEKVLVFSQSIDTLNFLENLLKKQERIIFRLDGQTAPQKRQDNTKTFNNNGAEVYLISTKAGGVGLNIQSANRIVIFDSGWNPVDDQQAIGRAWRIGQKLPVYVYRLIVGGTFEQDMHSKAVFKQQLATRVVDSKNVLSWSKKSNKMLHPIEPPPLLPNFQAYDGKDLVLDDFISSNGDHNIIQSIMSSDTFEEEDHVIHLTAEDRAEADRMVNMNKLRVTDPARYIRESAAGFPPALSTKPTLPVPTAATASIPNGATPMSMDGTFDSPLLLSAGGHNRHQALGPLQRVANSPALPTWKALPPATHNRPLRPTGLLTPVVGANTFHGQAVQTPRTQPPTRSDSTDQRFQGQAPGIFTGDTSTARDQFKRKMQSKLPPLQALKYVAASRTPADIAEGVTSEIEKERRLAACGVLPDGAHWRFLLEKLDSDRLVIVTAAGFWPPKYLALAERSYFEEKLAWLNHLSIEDFHHHLQVGPDYNSSEPMPHKTLDMTARSTSDSLESFRRIQARADGDGVRDSASSRQTRKFRLPDWGRDALKKHGATPQP